MDNIGTKIKQIRKSKNMTAKDVYNGILSKSMYFKFENNNSKISYDLLFKILYRLGLDLSDLEDMYDFNNRYIYILRNIYKLYYNDKKSLEIYINYLECQYVKTKNVKYNHMIILAKSLINKDNKDNNDNNILKQYIFEVDYWNKYELYIIIYSLHLFELEDIDIFINRFIKSINKNKVASNYELFVFLSAIVVKSIEYKDIFSFKKYLNILLDIFYPYQNTEYIFINMNIKFYKLLYLYINDKITIESIYEYISIISEIEPNSKIYSKKYFRILKLVKKYIIDS